MRHFNILETYCSPFVLKMKKGFSMIKCMALSLTRKLKKEKKIDSFKSHDCQVGFGRTFPGYITCFYVLMQHSVTGKKQKEGEALCSRPAEGAACCASLQNYKRDWKYSNLATGPLNMFPLWESGHISNCKFEQRKKHHILNAHVFFFPTAGCQFPNVLSTNSYTNWPWYLMTNCWFHPAGQLISSLNWHVAAGLWDQSASFERKLTAMMTPASRSDFPRAWQRLLITRGFHLLLEQLHLVLLTTQPTGGKEILLALSQNLFHGLFSRWIRHK